MGLGMYILACLEFDDGVAGTMFYVCSVVESGKRESILRYQQFIFESYPSHLQEHSQSGMFRRPSSL